MKQTIYIIGLLVFLFSCNTEKQEELVASDNTSNNKNYEMGLDEDPKDLLKEAYQQFKEGNDEKSIKLANKVLEYGRNVNDDDLIGGALSSLCRNAQRTLDTTRLAELSAELESLSKNSGDQKWMMKRVHMNAEMWRLIGNMKRPKLFIMKA